MQISKAGQLSFAPYCPAGWQSLSFKVQFRGALLQITVGQQDVCLNNSSEHPVSLNLFDKPTIVAANGNVIQAVVPPKTV